jgi:hypothetical protein
MLQPREYTISYRLEDGTRVERYYHHHVDAVFEEGLVLTLDYGWHDEAVTITQVDRHPDETDPGAAHAELYEAPPLGDEHTPPVQSTAVESL